MKRTLTTASVVSLPTRRTTPSWITRSSFAWIGFDISISSSRNIVPPFATSSRPGLSRTARHRDGVRGAPDQDLELAACERLGEIVPRAGAQRFDRGLHRRLPGDDDDDRLGVGRKRGGEQLHPGHLAHVEIHQDHVEGTALERLERLLAAPDRLDPIAFHLERAGAALPHRALVVHDQDAQARLRGGINGEEVREVTSGYTAPAVRAIETGWDRHAPSSPECRPSPPLQRRTPRADRSESAARLERLDRKSVG